MITGKRSNKIYMVVSIIIRKKIVFIAHQENNKVVRNNIMHGSEL